MSVIILSCADNNVRPINYSNETVENNEIELSKLEDKKTTKISIDEEKQLKELYNFVKKWNGKGKNLVLITHYSIITAVTNAVPSSGEIVVADKNFKVLGTIQTD